MLQRSGMSMKFRLLQTAPMSSFHQTQLLMLSERLLKDGQPSTSKALNQASLIRLIRHLLALSRTWTLSSSPTPTSIYPESQTQIYLTTQSSRIPSKV